MNIEENSTGEKLILEALPQLEKHGVDRTLGKRLWSEWTLTNSTF
jgi:hypothetical protein